MADTATDLRPLRINAVELLRQPGARRSIDVAVPAALLDITHERLRADADRGHPEPVIDVAVELEAINDGIVVKGTIGAPWATACRRCLTDIGGTAVVDVDELYQIDLIDEDAYPIENGQLDLTPMVREFALIELDAEQICRNECQGLCSVCGIDRNVASCDCDTTIKDDRWAALDGLVLDDG